MPTTARAEKGSSATAVVHLAFELGAKEWKLGFTTGLGRAARERAIGAGDLGALEREMAAAKRRFGVAEDARVVSCYEAGREGFWLHLRRRHVDHTPDVLLGADPARQQAQQALQVQLVRLATPLATVDLDARGVHHVILDPLPDQPPRARDIDR